MARATFLACIIYLQVTATMWQCPFTTELPKPSHKHGSRPLVDHHNICSIYLYLLYKDNWIGFLKNIFYLICSLVPKPRPTVLRPETENYL